MLERDIDRVPYTERWGVTGKNFPSREVWIGKQNAMMAKDMVEVVPVT